jgi:hypothetical protein
MAPALDFSKVISGQNYMYHESQEDSQNGAKSQAAEHLHLGATTNPKFKPTLEFYKPFPCANPQLKIVQGKALQGTELMSRLGLKTISFKAEKKNGSSAKYKNYCSQQSLTPFRVYKRGRHGDAKSQGCLRPTRNGLLHVIPQASYRVCWMVRHH